MGRRQCGVVIAPDKFKGSLTALEAAAAMARGVARALPEASIDQVPMADGGEGTTQALVAATGGSIREAQVTGPLGEPVVACFGLLGDGQTAVIEMAAASGLVLVPGRETQPLDRHHARAPASCSWRRSPPERDASSSASAAARPTTAGPAWASRSAFACSMKTAATWNPAAAAWAAWHASIRPDAAASSTASKSPSPATSPTPSAAPREPRPFTARKKGLPRQMVEALDRNLAHFAAIVDRDLGVAIKDQPGSGAAGGLGGGLVAFAAGKLEPGVNLVIDAVKLAERLENADLCLTGEGAIDAQSAFGKTAVGVAPAGSLAPLSRPGIGRLDRSGSRGGPRTGHRRVFLDLSRPDQPRPGDRARPSTLLERATEQAVRAISGRPAPTDFR